MSSGVSQEKARLIAKMIIHLARLSKNEYDEIIGDGKDEA